MYILGIYMWFRKLIVQFFFFIDKIVYGLIPSIYDLLLSIAKTSVLTQSDIAEMADRIYKLLAIFMVFKVVLSLITYIVNPDDFSDKSKGLSKLGTNSIIVLALLILTPYIFNYAYQLQTIVLEDNAIATLIFGDKNGSGKNSFLNSAGDSMTYITMSTVFTPDLSLGDLYKCSSLISRKTKDNYEFNGPCKDALTAYTKDNPNFTSQMLDDYIAGVENNSLGLVFRQNLAIATDKDDENFIMSYKCIFSTVIGVIIILLLITNCMDIAVRSIKLALLQLLAPIPIISYIDPKSGKDGLFKKWYEMCFKTYLSLFIRILAIYFALYIIEKVASFKMVDIIDGSYQTNAFVAIFIIIGALMFAKQFPKLLEGLGFKMDGGFSLNPLKKLENDALFGKGVKALPAAGLAGAAAFGTNLIARRGNPFSAAAGAISATSKGLMGAIKGEKFGKNFSNSYSGAMKARTNRADRKELGINAIDVAKENAKSAMHIPNTAQKYESRNKHLGDYITAGKAAKTRAESEVDKKASGITVGGQNLGALKNYSELLKNQDVSNLADSQKMQHAEKVAQAESEYFKARKTAVNAYVSSSDSLKQDKINIGGVDVQGFKDVFEGSDEIVTSNLSKMKQLNSDYKMGAPVNEQNIGSTVQAAENEQARLQSDRSYSQAQLISQQAQKEKSNK